MHSSFIPLGIIKFFTKYNLIASEHASYDFYKNRPIEKFLYKIVSSKFDHITTVSSQCKNLFPKKISKRMIVIQNPIENQDYALNQIKQNKTILSVGSLKDYKNHSLLINVFCKLQKNFPTWNLKIIGDGEEYENLSDQINGIKSISLIKSQKNLKEYYLHASIFVIPSEFESFSLVTAEALHYQLPVFGFNNCIGLQDLIIDGENGCLVDSNGDKSLNLYNKLNYYLSNDKYKNLSKNNKKLISVYEINNVVNKWNDLIEK